MKTFTILCVLMSMLNASELADSDSFKGMWIAVPLLMLSFILIYAGNKEEAQKTDKTPTQNDEIHRVK